MRAVDGGDAFAEPSLVLGLIMKMSIRVPNCGNGCSRAAAESYGHLYHFPSSCKPSPEHADPGVSVDPRYWSPACARRVDLFRQRAHAVIAIERR